MTDETYEKAKQLKDDIESIKRQVNEIKKEHPSLIPYEELSETQKDYDRNTSIETLKVLLALGFEIKKK